MDATINVVRQLSVAQAAAIINVVIVVGKSEVVFFLSYTDYCSAIDLPAIGISPCCWSSQADYKCSNMVRQMTATSRSSNTRTHVAI